MAGRRTRDAGRRTYEILAGYWPNASEEEQVVARPLNTKPKYGSTRLVGTLLEHDLVDEFRLMIDPVLLGGGKRVFVDDGQLRPFRLVDSQVATTGAILATYAR